MNDSSFITFFTYMQRQNVIPFWKELFVAFMLSSHQRRFDGALKRHQSVTKLD